MLLLQILERIFIIVVSKKYLYLFEISYFNSYYLNDTNSYLKRKIMIKE